MNVLVTGGAGFIGTNLILHLLTKKHTVYSLDDYSTGLRANEIEGGNYIEGDISDISKIKIPIDLVYHLAAKARIQPSFIYPEEYIKTNFDGTYSVIKYCINNNIPLIYAGSSSKHSGRYKNPYTFSKDLGEDIIKLYQTHYGLRASITRFYNVYGPYQLLEGEYTTLIGKWINNIKKGEQCCIYGDGEQRRDFTHVYDIVDALILIMEQQAYGYEFELGRGKNHSVNEVAQMFNINPKYLPSKKGEAQNTLNTNSLAQEVLGWNPTQNLEEYLKDII